MIFGDPARFAIEAALQPRRPVKDAVGHISLWLGGRRLGAFDETVALAVPVEQLTIRGRKRQRDTVLDSLSAAAALSLVEYALYGEMPPRSLQESTRDYERYWHFCLAPGLSEALDGEFIVILGDRMGRRLLWREKVPSAVYEVVLAAGEYENVVRQFVDWIASQTGYFPSAD